MKRMMKAFNGRLHGYREAMNAGSDDAMYEVLKRNLYGTAEIEIPQESLQAITEFVRFNFKQDAHEIAQGRTTFNYEMLKG